MNEESNLDWSLDEEIDKYEEEIKRSWEKPVFDHLFCEKCRRCLVFLKHVPFTEAARRIGCNYGRRRIWETPCPKCGGEMDVTSSLTPEALAEMACCSEREVRQRRARRRKIWLNYTYVILGCLSLVLIFLTV